MPKTFNNRLTQPYKQLHIKVALVNQLTRN